MLMRTIPVMTNAAKPLRIEAFPIQHVGPGEVFPHPCLYVILLFLGKLIEVCADVYSSDLRVVFPDTMRTWTAHASHVCYSDSLAPPIPDVMRQCANHSEESGINERDVAELDGLVCAFELQAVKPHHLFLLLVIKVSKLTASTLKFLTLTICCGGDWVSFTVIVHFTF